MLFGADIIAHQCLYLISFIRKFDTQFDSRTYQHTTQIHYTINPHIGLLYNGRSIRYQIIQRSGVHSIRSLYIHIRIQRRTIESNCTPILNHKVLANHFLQTEFIHSLINPVITEHPDISFIIKFRPDISRPFSGDIISGNRVHNNPHSSVGSCIHQNIQPDIRFLLFCFRLTFLLYLVIIRDNLNRVLNGPTRRFVNEFNKLIARGRRYTTINISKSRIPIRCHGGIHFQSLCGITGQHYISGSIYSSIERHIRRFFRIHHKHIISLYLETIIQILEMFIMQISV